MLKIEKEVRGLTGTARNVTVDNVDADVTVEVREVVKYLDGEGGDECPLQRALTKLAADALALADDWDRGKAGRGEVAVRIAALRAGYLGAM